MTRTNTILALTIGILLASTAAQADVITTMTGQGADTKVGYSQSGTNPVTEVDTNYGAEGTLHDIKVPSSHWRIFTDTTYIAKYSSDSTFPAFSGQARVSRPRNSTCVPVRSLATGYTISTD
jgi:hypothetical protein